MTTKTLINDLGKYLKEQKVNVKNEEKVHMLIDNFLEEQRIPDYVLTDYFAGWWKQKLQSILCFYILVPSAFGKPYRVKLAEVQFSKHRNEEISGILRVVNCEEPFYSKMSFDEYCQYMRRNENTEKYDQERKEILDQFKHNIVKYEIHSNSDLQDKMKEVNQMKKDLEQMEYDIKYLKNVIDIPEFN